jgi:hypothetical protein
MTAAERQRRHRLLTTQQQENSMSDAVLELRVPPPLPETRKDLMKQYKLKRHRSINDLVEEIIVKLWDNDANFMKYVNAIYDSQAVEGSMDDDDVMAALIIRDTAKRDKHVEVADQNVHTIKLAMRVALRRFDLGRGQRYDLARLPAPTISAPQEPPQLPEPAAE